MCNWISKDENERLNLKKKGAYWNIAHILKKLYAWIYDRQKTAEVSLLVLAAQNRKK